MDIDIGTLVFWIIVILVAIINWSRRGSTPEAQESDIPPTLRKEDLPDATRRLYDQEYEVPVAPPKTGQPRPVTRRPEVPLPGPVSRKVEHPTKQPVTPSRPATVPQVHRKRMDEDEFESMTEGEEPPRRLQKRSVPPSSRPPVPPGTTRKSAAARPSPPRKVVPVPSVQAAPRPTVPRPGMATPPTRNETPPRSVTAPPPAATRSPRFRAALKSPVARRQAVLYREILAPPLGLRPPDMPEFDYPFL